VQLEIANSLWVRQGIPLAEDFVETNEMYYEAEVSALDFYDPAATKVINAWVKDKTHDKIESIIDRLTAEDVLLLVNAVYFNGKWEHEFNEKVTADRDFHLSDGSAKRHPFMRRNAEYPYYRGEGFQAISLPYGNGRVSMLVFLPDRWEGEEFGVVDDEGEVIAEPGPLPDFGQALAGFVEQLTPENWDRWLDSLRTIEGDIILPKFKHEYEQTLNDVLTELGMGDAFDPTKADFNGMLPAPIDMPFYISKVLHKTFVEVNEQGTEAAAVTSVQMAMTAMPMEEETFTMTCDRPFFYAIRDDRTGTVLFMGAVTDPEL